MVIDIRDLGHECKRFRKQLGYTQFDVADDLGFSVVNISAFETGRNDSARILYWYVEHGFTGVNE